MRSIVALAAAFVFCTAAFGTPFRLHKAYLDRSATADQGVTIPASVPLNARLIANETIYHLNRGGLSTKDYRKKLENALPGQMPMPPRVDLIFELQNKGN